MRVMAAADISETVLNGEVHEQDVRARRPIHVDKVTADTASSSDSFDSDEGYTKIKDKSAESAILDPPASKRTSFAILFAIFLCAAVMLYGTYSCFPQMEEEEKVHIKLPRSLEDARKLGLVLTKYRTEHYLQVLSAFAITYMFLQTFAIPGSIFLSILSGYLFSVPVALITVCSCSALGATCCYGVTSVVGRGMVARYFPEKVKAWSDQVNHHREHLLNYIIFLRITPFLPNWFINIASPVINVDVMPFALGTFIGVAPPSILAIQTGTTLYDMTESVSNFSWRRILFLAVLAVMSLLPILFKKKLRSRLE